MGGPLSRCTHADRPALQDFFRSSISTLSSLLSIRQQLLSASPPSHATPRLEYLTKHVLLYGKMYRALNAHNPAHFAAMDVALPLEGVYFQVVQEAAQDVLGKVDGASLRRPAADNSS